MSNQQPVSFLDRMPEAERKKAEERAARRLEKAKSQKGLSVPPEFYDASSLGYYYGWEGVMAYRRGYTVVPKTDEDLEEDLKQAKREGKDPKFISLYKREMLTSTEALLLLEGADKVWYKKLSEQAHAGVIGNTYKLNGTYAEALKPIEERASIE